MHFKLISDRSWWHCRFIRKIENGRPNFESQRIGCDSSDPSRSSDGTIETMRRDQTDSATRPAPSWIPSKFNFLCTFEVQFYTFANQTNFIEWKSSSNLFQHTHSGRIHLFQCTCLVSLYISCIL